MFLLAYRSPHRPLPLYIYIYEIIQSLNRTLIMLFTPDSLSIDWYLQISIKWIVWMSTRHHDFFNIFEMLWIYNLTQNLAITHHKLSFDTFFIKSSYKYGTWAVLAHFVIWQFMLRHKGSKNEKKCNLLVLSKSTLDIS